MKRALALLRVSTDGQDVARQRADIEKLKKLHSLDVVRSLELVGISGTTTLTNEEVQQVLREVQQPGIDGLALSSVGRLFRPRRGSHFGILDGLQLDVVLADNSVVIEISHQVDSPGNNRDIGHQHTFGRLAR